jgi:integrase
VWLTSGNFTAVLFTSLSRNPSNQSPCGVRKTIVYCNHNADVMYVKALVSFSIQEFGLDCRNAFAGVYLAPDDASQKRKPLSSEQIRLVQKQCYEMDDDVRWLVALISDTGMRLAEASGLLIEDVKVDHLYLHCEGAYH